MSNGSSWYNALQTSLTKRFSKGLQFLAPYTFSRALSINGSNTSASGIGAGPGDQTNARNQYGRSDFNREQRFVLSYVYELPSFGGDNAIRKALLKGWAVAGVTTIQSGQRLTLTGTNANNAFGITVDRAQLTPNCTYDQLRTGGSVTQNVRSFFNASCIQRSASGAAAWPIIGADGRASAFGGAGIGIVTGPGQYNWDISMIKRTTIRENMNLEFRTELFNGFNTPQFSNPQLNVSQSTFGVISGTSVNPRIIQLAMKVNF